MAKKIGDLFVQLKLDNKQFKENLNQSLKQSKVTSRGMMQAFAVVTIALGAVGTALSKVTKDMMRYGLEVDKSSKIMELNVIQTQKLRYAAEQEHTSLQAVEKGIMNLNVRLGYAGDKMASYIRYFDALDIAYRKTDGTLRNAYDVFGDLFDVMEGGNVTTEETAAVMQLVGARAAKELIPMLKKGKEWFQKMGDEADRLGIILDRDTIRLIKETDDSLTELKAGFRGLTYLIGKETIPLFKDFTTVLTRITLQVKAITEATTRSEKAYRLMSMLLPQVFKPLEEAKIEHVVNQMNKLKKEGKENTTTYQMLSEKLKFLWTEFDGMGEISIPNFNEKLRNTRDIVREANEEIEEAKKIWEDWEKIQMVPSIPTPKTMGFEPWLPKLKKDTEEVKEEVMDLEGVFSSLGSVMGKVLKGGKLEMSDFLSVLVEFLPGGGILSKLTGSLFGMGKGGITVPKGTAPVFGMQEGGVVATETTVSPGGVPFGEKGWEVFMTGQQLTDLFKSMKPTIIIDKKIGSYVIVNELEEMDETNLFRTNRAIQDRVFGKEDKLSR